PVIAGGGYVEESLDLRFDRRGSYKQRTFQVSTKFPFGFTERRERVTIQQEIIVYPCLDPQPGFEMLLNSLSGELGGRDRGRGTEFFRIRPYEVSDSAGDVDWKATARTARLQIREFAQEQDRAVLIFLDLNLVSNDAATAAANTDWFETAVDG